METKTFDARIIGTLTCGIVLHPGGFGGVQEAMEHIAGHPVWTHEMINKPLQQRVKDAILASYPDWPMGVPAYWKAFGAMLLERYPDGVTLPKGTAKRTEDPITSLQRVLGGQS